MRTLHLFAGAGGGLLADLILGHTPICAVEIDKHCCNVLRTRAEDGWFPELHVHEGDIRLFDPSDWKSRVDCVHAGFPCQDISAANPHGRGIEGERSGLVWEVFRVIDVVEPAFVFFENSPRLRTKGRREIIAALVARGYSWRDGTVAASDVGAPHQRKRWWLLAANADGLRKLQQERGQQKLWGRIDNGAEETSSVADIMRAGLQNSRGGAAAETQADIKKHSALGVDEEHDEIPAPWFAVEPDVGDLVHGLAHELVPGPKVVRALGNGQVPLQAALAWVLLGGPTNW